MTERIMLKTAKRINNILREKDTAKCTKFCKFLCYPMTYLSLPSENLFLQVTLGRYMLILDYATCLLTVWLMESLSEQQQRSMHGTKQGPGQIC